MRIVDKCSKSAKKQQKKKQTNFFAMYHSSTGNWPDSKLPKGWWVVGSGGTLDKRYPGETQFSGPLDTVGEAKRIIKKDMQWMLATGNVKRFKIRSSIRSSMVM